MDDLHPIRIWRVDKRFDKKLAAIRDIMKRSRKKYGQAGGIQIYEMPMELDKDLIDSFLSLQGLLYKQNEATQFLQSFLKFWDEHRQVFQVDSTLCQALANTEIEDVPWGALRLPHPEFYISFGDYGQDSFAIGDFEYIIDGAYIRHVPQESALFPNDTLLIAFTSRLIYPSYKEARDQRAVQGFHFSEPIYNYAISGAGCLTIGDAIRKGESEYRGYCRRMDDRLHQAATDWASEVDVIPFGEHIHPNEEKFNRGKAIILSSVPVLFNSIFYLTHKPESHRETYPKTAPTDQVQELHKTRNPQIRKSILDSLARKGFSKVTFVRDPDLSESLESLSSGRTVRAHWRRGHWRHQPYGKGLSSRKWVWILPVLVKKEEELSLGTIHDVNN